MNNFSEALQRRKILVNLAALFSGCLNAAMASQRLLRFVVPLHYSGGWPRAVIQHLQNQLNQPSIIEEKFGANGILAMRYVLQQSDDSPTVLLSSISTSTLNFLTKSDFGEDRKKYFKAVGMLFRLPMALVVSEHAPTSFHDFLDYGRSHQGVLNYASPGVGSFPHLHGLLLCKIFGFEATHVPQSGSTLLQVMSGVVDFAFVNFDAVLPTAKSNKFRVLAITSDKRSPLMPNIPTISEFNNSFVTWSNMSILVKRNTNLNLVNDLNGVIKRMLVDASWRELAKNNGVFLPESHSPNDCDQWLDDEFQLWRAMLQRYPVELGNT